MPSTGQYYSGPAGAYAPSYPTGAGASGFSTAPPRYTPHESNRVVTNHTTGSTHIEERRPLLFQPTRNPGDKASFALLAVLLFIFIFCPLVYFSDVTLYKHMYEDVRVRAGRLEQQNAAFEGEIHGLRTQLHDLQGKLTNYKVLAFWEIARTMHTNMDVWVGADDPGAGPKFWSYGLTNGLFNNNDPPVTSIKLHFGAGKPAIVESIEHRRIVGYKVESNRWNNGWWIATGLNEFGEGGSHEVKFDAKPSINGAEYEVTVFYADWKL